MSLLRRDDMRGGIILMYWNMSRLIIQQNIIFFLGVDYTILGNVKHVEWIVLIHQNHPTLYPVSAKWDHINIRFIPNCTRNIDWSPILTISRLAFKVFSRRQLTKTFWFILITLHCRKLIDHISPPSPFLLLNTKPQYREWTVGLLSSVACPPCLCSLLPAKSLFSILIGQKMQMTGLDNANNMRNATCANTQTSIEWPYCTFLKLWQNCHSENGIHDDLGIVYMNPDWVTTYNPNSFRIYCDYTGLKCICLYESGLSYDSFV